MKANTRGGVRIELRRSRKKEGRRGAPRPNPIVRPLYVPVTCRMIAGAPWRREPTWPHWHEAVTPSSPGPAASGPSGYRTHVPTDSGSFVPSRRK